MIVKSQQNRIELVARPGKSVQKGQTDVAGSTKVKRIKIALVVRLDPKKAVARPSKECCRQARTIAALFLVFLAVTGSAVVPVVTGVD